MNVTMPLTMPSGLGHSAAEKEKFSAQPSVYICSSIHSLYSRLQDGGDGENTAEFASTSVHVVVAPPISSKPGLQL